MATCLACADDSNAPSMSSAAAACTCNAGYTGPNGGPCSPCALGTYKIASGSAACTSCVAGTYSVAEGATAEETCALCPLNSVSPSMSSAVDACTCNAGYTGPDGGPCSPCDAGTFKNTSGSAACRSCGIGRYSDVSGASACALCPAGSSSAGGAADITNCVCIAGFYGANGGPCTACEPTFTSSPGSLDASACGCAANTYTYFSTSISCESCPDDTFNSFDTNSKDISTCWCVPGSYYASSQCNLCETGKFWESGQCSNCPAGTFSDVSGAISSSVCATCLAGTYSGAGSSACTTCPARSSSLDGSASIENCICDAGSTGPNGGPCVLCAVGKYKVANGIEECTDCPVDTYSGTLGANGSETCLSCPEASSSPVSSSAITACTCNAGASGPNGGPCDLCVIGKYKTATGTAACTSCEVNTFSSVVGATASVTCVACAANSQSGEASSVCVCNEGYTGPDGGPCLACVSGTFKPDTGSSACTLCPNSTFSELPASTNASVCEACQANAVSAAGSVSQEYCYCVPGYAHAEGEYTCEACTPGTYNSQLGRRACSNCTIGMYSLNFSAISPETCKYCPAGQWSPEGSANCNLCPANSRTLGVSGLITDCVCNRGYTGPSGSTCVACAVGLYKDVTGPDACTACPALMSSFPGTERATDCWCVSGYVKVSGVCVEMIPRVTQITGTLKDITSNASSTEIQNATEKLRRNISEQLNIAIELVQVDLVQNSSNQVQVLLFARSETEVTLLDRKVRFAREPPRPTLLPFLLVPIGNSSIGEPRVVLITVDIHHEARFVSRESEMLFTVTEGMSETLDVDAHDISYVFDESMHTDIPRVIMSVRTSTYEEYVRVLAAANALLAQGNVSMPEMTVQVLTVGDAGPSGLNATYALIRQDGTPMEEHEVSAANETLVRQFSWYYDVPAYDVSVIERKLENICFKNTSY